MNYEKMAIYFFIKMKDIPILLVSILTLLWRMLKCGNALVAFYKEKYALEDNYLYLRC